MSAVRILFATPELDDFVRVGGLGAVSAAFRERETGGSP
jgi:glycogen synthase